MLCIKIHFVLWCPSPFVEKIFFYLTAVWNSINYTCAQVFLNSVSLICLYIFMSISYCPDYYSFIIGLRIQWCKSSLFFYKIILTSRGHWYFNMNFRIILNISMKTTKLSFLGFDWDCIESISLFAENWHFRNIES